MKVGKALGPSGIVVEMIRAASDMGTSMICDLAATIICNGKVSSDWEQSFIVCLYKGKGDALERGNYHSLKLTEQVMKVLERIVDGLIRQLVSVNDSQFGFVPGRGTTDAICIVRQLQEKYLAANKRLYMAFVDLENAVDQEPWKVFWWALRKLDVEEWIVRLVKGMYANAHPCWWVVQWRVWSEGHSPRLGTQPAALHHCAWSIITPVLLWGSLGGPLCQWPCCHRWIARGMCQEALDLERSNGGERTESKCRKDDHDLWYRPGSPAEFSEFPCNVCRTGVGNNSIFCNGCKHWVRKKCSGLKHLTKDPYYRCTQCQGTACPLDGRPQREVQVGPDKLEVVASFAT